MNRTQLKLGSIGATSLAEAIVGHLSMATSAIGKDRRKAEAEWAFAEAMAGKLIEIVGQIRKENEKQRQAEWEAEYASRYERAM